MQASNRIVLPKLHDGQKRLFRGLPPNNTGGRTVWHCGRRYGKTTALETLGAWWAANGQRVGWFAPQYSLMMPSFNRMVRTIRPVVASSSKTDKICETLTGGCIEGWSLENEDAGRSRFYDKVIIDEAGLVTKGLKQIFDEAIAGTLIDRNGDAILAGTPKGISDESFFYLAAHNLDDKRKWTAFQASTYDNPTLSQEAKDRLINEYAPMVYKQEILAEFIDWNGNALIGLDSLLVGGNGVDYPANCTAVFATIDSAVKTGRQHDGTGVVYWAFLPQFAAPHRLVVLDWDIVQIEGALLETWLPTVFENLEVFAGRCGARGGSIGALIEDKASGTILLQQAIRRGWPATAIDSKLTAMGKDERGLSVSGYAYRGDVKISQHAHDKVVQYKGRSKNFLESQVCGFRIGVDDGEDDLYDAFCYGIAVSLGDGAGF